MDMCMKDGKYLCSLCKYSEEGSIKCGHHNLEKEPPEDTFYVPKLPTTADTQN